MIDVSGAGALKSSKHAAEAQKFLAFLVSPAAQKILAHDESYEYPLGSGVKTTRGLVPVRDAAARPDHGRRSSATARFAIALLRDASCSRRLSDCRPDADGAAHRDRASPASAPPAARGLCWSSGLVVAGVVLLPLAFLVLQARARRLERRCARCSSGT